MSWVSVDPDGNFASAEPADEIRIVDGVPQYSGEEGRLAWHEVPVERFYTDAELSRAFEGTLHPALGEVRDGTGAVVGPLWGPAVENGAPLTQWAFRKGLSPLGDWGHYIVLISVLLFAISTAISWSYYGDRCANYLFGHRAVLPYKIAFVIMHFLGAVVSLNVAWALGDLFLALVIVPNLLALILLSGQVRGMTDSYFSRKPWLSQPRAKSGH